MEPRIIVKHLDAAKSGQVEEFPVSQKKEIIIGRDPSCDLKFDPNSDLVSRRHSKITVSASDPSNYTIEDLGSSNGTFVNNQRIFSPAKLNCCDMIRLGPGGPEFEFDVTPRPAEMIKKTRLADSTATAATLAIPPTRQATPVTTGPVTAATTSTAPKPIGKATVERMINDSKKHNQKVIYYSVGAVLLITAAVAGWVVMKSKQIDNIWNSSHNQPNGAKPDQDQKPKEQSAADIAKTKTEATVLIEVGWKIIDTASGKQLYHNTLPSSQLRSFPGNLDDSVPLFIEIADKIYEPFLCTDDKGGNNPAIGGNHRGSGFVVSEGGFILTNRHVAAAWKSDYDFPSRSGLGVVLQGDKKHKIITKQEFPQWIPEQAKYVFTDCGSLKYYHKLDQLIPNGKALEGRNDYLDVAFPKNRIRVSASLARVSDHTDVAMIKISMPEPLKKVELYDNYDLIKVGDPVTVLGYPGLSDHVLGVILSKDIFNQQISVKEIPDPTLSVGYIGRIMRGQEGLSEAAYFSGDYYQLTINSTGAGNSGGPMFDAQGRVIGIFSLGIHYDVDASGAVPIRYGMELMGIQPTTK